MYEGDLNRGGYTASSLGKPLEDALNAPVTQGHVDLDGLEIGTLVVGEVEDPRLVCALINLCIRIHHTRGGFNAWHMEHDDGGEYV